MVKYSKQRVKVKNCDDEDYIEEFREKVYKIAAGGSIVMKRREAVRFLASVPPDLHGEPRIKALKIIEVMGPTDENTEKEYVSHLTGEAFENQAQLDKHLKQNKDKVFKSKEEDTPCPICGREFKSKDVLIKHMVEHSQSQQIGQGQKEPPKKEKPFKLNKKEK